MSPWTSLQNIDYLHQKNHGLSGVNVTETIFSLLSYTSMIAIKHERSHLKQILLNLNTSTVPIFSKNNYNISATCMTKSFLH